MVLVSGVDPSRALNAEAKAFQVRVAGFGVQGFPALFHLTSSLTVSPMASSLLSHVVSPSRSEPTVHTCRMPALLLLMCIHARRASLAAAAFASSDPDPAASAAQCQTAFVVGRNRPERGLPLTRCVLPQHPAKKMRFLVGKRGSGSKTELAAIGGAWEPCDGGHPEADPAALVATAQRTFRDATGVDLSACTQWCVAGFRSLASSSGLLSQRGPRHGGPGGG